MILKLTSEDFIQTFIELMNYFYIVFFINICGQIKPFFLRSIDFYYFLLSPTTDMSKNYDNIVGTNERCTQAAALLFFVYSCIYKRNLKINSSEK